MPASPPSPAYRTTPIPRPLAPARTPAEPPADTVPFTWSCQCLNVTCFGRIRKDVHQRIEQNEASGSQESKQSEATTSAWVGEEHAVSFSLWFRWLIEETTRLCYLRRTRRKKGSRAYAKWRP